MIKKAIHIVVMLFLYACSSDSSKLSNTQKFSLPEKSISTFDFVDQFGNYRLIQEAKFQKNKLITRRKIYSLTNLDEPLEVTVAVSKLGSVKGKRTLRPEVSQHRVWLEKQRYFSQLKLSIKTKSLIATLKSPESKWNGKKSFAFPKGRQFCFFSQMAECLKLQGLLEKSKENAVSFNFIWDSYPYHQEQYSQVLAGPFNKATVELKKVGKNELQYEVNIGNQVLFYHYDKQYNFMKLFWVAQGLSLKSLDIKE